jgi:aminoglycoside phosphotransferase (APT) family kinase protein
VVRIEDAVAAALPGVRPRSLRTIDTGWDSVAVDVNGDWIVRVARRHASAARYRLEEALVPALAPTLPLAVPVPVRTGDGWILTRRIGGEPFREQPAAAQVGGELGAFLRALHTFPVERARELGAGLHDRERDAREFRARVLPLLNTDERARAERLLDEYVTQMFAPAVVHMDLVHEHVLVDEGQITGVIDWTDACLGDPAIDLAWPLHGAQPALALAVAETYGVDTKLVRRALVYHALGPWHEVVYGLDIDTRSVDTGLAGVRERLTRVTARPDTMIR